MLIKDERTHYVYENKENIDKMSIENTGIYVEEKPICTFSRDNLTDTKPSKGLFVQTASQLALSP